MTLPTHPTLEGTGPSRLGFIPPLLLVLLLCGCTGREHVSPAEFQKQYGWVGKPQTMHDVAYLGQRDGRAFLRVSSMSPVSQKWKDRILYTELKELDPAFRDALPGNVFEPPKPGGQPLE